MHRQGRRLLWYSATLLLVRAVCGQTPVALDSAGNIWKADATANNFTCAFAYFVGGQYPVRCNSVVVTELDPTGTQVLFKTTLGGKGNSVAVAIAADSTGNVYITGYTNAADFPVTTGALQTLNTITFSGQTPIQNSPILMPGGDTFVTKFKPDGSMGYSTFLGGSSGVLPFAISADATGSAYVAGSCCDFPLTESPFSSQPGDFLAKIDPAGQALIFATSFPGAITAVTVDSNGSVYLAGFTDATLITTPGAAQPVFGGGGGDGFVAKLNASGNSLIYSTYLGGPGTDEAHALAIDSQGAAWVGGVTDTGFPGISGAGGAFLLKVAPDGSRIETGSSFGPHAPNGGSIAEFLAIDALDNVYASGFLDQYTGQFSASGFQPTSNAQLSAPCAALPLGDGFLIEAALNGSWVYASYACQYGPLFVTAPGHLLTYSSTGALTVYLTSPPAMDFASPVNAASYTTAIAPGEIVTLFGSGLGPTRGVVGQPDASGRYTTSLAGVQVAFSGVAAPLLYVQAGQINTVVPKEVGNSATIQISYQGQNAPPLNVPSQPANPGVFAIVNQDGTVNSAANPAQSGSTISVYATGAGVPDLPDGQIVPLSPLFPFDPQSDGDAVLFSGVAGTIVWEGAAPGLILGVTQINVQLPSIFVAAPSTSVSVVVQWAATFKSTPFAVFVAP